MSGRTSFSASRSPFRALTGQESLATSQADDEGHGGDKGALISFQ
jgi:hypothetical protein